MIGLPEIDFADQSRSGIRRRPIRYRLAELPITPLGGAPVNGGMPLVASAPLICGGWMLSLQSANPGRSNGTMTMRSLK